MLAVLVVCLLDTTTGKLGVGAGAAVFRLSRLVFWQGRVSGGEADEPDWVDGFDRSDVEDDEDKVESSRLYILGSS